MTAESSTSHEPTTAGNYFVSNYPPFSTWKREAVADFETALQTPPPAGRPLGLYLHVPFCRKRCHFCYFKVFTGRNSKEIGGYIDTMIAELDLYRDAPFIGGRDLDFIYFGGGTPSYLGSRQLTELTDALKERLPWDKAQEVTFECEPGTLNERKLQTIRDLGVTRLSLGIENFSDHVLEINGRAHRSKEVFAAYEAARAAEFPQINIDLIAGMVEETEENWQDTVQRTLDLQPDSITIYQMEIPYNTTIYQQMKDDGRLVAPVADWETKRRWVREAFEALEAAGYHVGSAYTAVRDPKTTRFCYRDQLWQGADLLSLGVASFGMIDGVHYQNNAKWEGYMDSIAAGERPVYRALRPTDDERLIRETILQLKLGHLDRDYFQQKFGVDLLARFAEPFARLTDWGYLTTDDAQLRLNRDGLLQVDRLLHEFFLPEHRDIRYT